MNSNVLENKEGYELSENQKNLWQIGNKTPEIFYNQTLLKIGKEVDCDQLTNAIKKLIARHEALSFRLHKNDKYLFPIQYSEGDSKLEFKVIDLGNNQLDEAIKEELDYPYDASKNEPIRFCAIQIDGQIKYVLVRLYAFWGDTYSTTFFCEELSEILADIDTYESEEKVDFTSFCSWQNELINNPEEEATSFWDSYDFRIEEEVVPFSLDTKLEFNPSKKNVLSINLENYNELKKFCVENDFQASQLLLSNYVNYLSQFTDSNITLGYKPFARNYEELDKTLGFVAKTIPVTINNTNKQTLREVLKDVQQQVTTVNDWSDYFTLNRKNEAKENNQSRFKYCFEFIDLSSGFKNENKIEDLDVVQDAFDIKVCCVDYGEKIAIDLYYDQSKFGSSEIEVIIVQLRLELSNLYNDKSLDGTTISSLEREIIENSNDTKTDFEPVNSIVELFKYHAKTSPQAIAITTDNNVVSYKELDQKSNQLKNYLLQDVGINKGDAVCILGGRSEWFITSVLGVMKTGAFYVPIDRDYPKERISYILKESNCKVLICDADLYDQYNFDTIPKVINSDSEIYNKVYKDVQVPVLNNDIAYCIYTSGSTGNPKGCTISQGNLLNYIQWANSFYFDNDDLGNWSLITSVSFDLTVTSIFTSLTRGKKIWIGDKEKDINGLLKESFERKDVDTLKLTPSHLSLIKELEIKQTNVRKVICGGEQLTLNQVRNLWEINKDIEVYNEYGPTETTVGCIVKKITPQYSKILIGKPISNTTIDIVDDKGELCKVGMIGDVLIGGAQVANGYLNRQDLTKEKFITNPKNENAKLYHTGDLARWLPNGEIEYIGRKDNQLKIRGHRIELGEIEQNILLNTEVSSTSVMIRGNNSEDLELIAYITSDQKIKSENVRSFLLDKLPSYMIPSVFIQLKELPLTINGKVDAKRLVELGEIELKNKSEYVAPRNETENKLVEIWGKILNVEKIGIRDDFFALGGHSIKATRLINEYQKLFDIKLALKEVFENSTIELHAMLIKSSKKIKYEEIKRAEIAESYPLSSSQLRLWVLSQFKDTSSAYNIPNSVVLTGDYNIENFVTAINLTIDRHEILRTIFKEDDEGEIRQWVLSREELDFAIDYQDFTTYADKDQLIKSYIQKDAFKDFDLEKGPLLRASILKVSDSQMVFYYNMHHIISDGWSMNILARDVEAFYTSLEAGEAFSLPELKIQYKDFASWEKSKLECKDALVDKEFWLHQLSGELPGLNLPSTKTRPKVKTHNGRRLYTFISKELTDKINGFVTENGGSMFMTLLTSWNILMYKYTANQDIIIGTPVAGRQHSNLEDQIGFYINSLALRNTVNPEDDFIQLYENVKQATLTAFSHQMYPFDRIVQELDLIRNTSRNAVFDMMLILQNNEEEGIDIDSEKLAVNQIIDKGVSMAKFDLSINFKEVTEHLYFEISYNEDVYEKNLVEGLMKDYERLLLNLLETPEKLISRITFLSKKEEKLLLDKFNNTEVYYSKEETLVSLFENQVRKTPDSQALIFSGKKITYKELDCLSNQFADFLRSNYSINQGDFVSFKLNRSEWIVISLLGIMKCGATYVPIDPEYPKERIAYIESDCQSKLCIDNQMLDQFKEHQHLYSKNSIDVKIEPTDLAYVIYTSGSTGNPKGVMIEHKGIVNTVLSQIEIFELGQCNNSLQFASFSFDASISEVFITLLSGTSLHVVNDELRNNPSLLETYIQENKIDIATLPPSYLKLMNTDSLKSMKRLITAGEAPAYDKVEEYLAHGTYYNAYGPTEVSICGSVFKIPKGSTLDSNTIPIGYPIANTKIYILDAYNNLQPIGVVGEVCIGGAGLAKGYLNQEDLTKRKFIKNPFEENGKIYKTGDLGKYLPNGAIEFLGRIDDQIKIRGHRVELGEIENCLSSKKKVKETVVMVQDIQGIKELVVYLTADEPQNTTDLINHLSTKLPSYMIPSYYVQLDTIPLTVNGKVNKQLLPSPSTSGLSSNIQYVAPENEIQEKLVLIWHKFLNKKKIGVNDNFFHIGGDSIKGMRIISEIQKEFNVKVDIETLFNDATIKKISEEIIVDFWYKEEIEEDKVADKIII